jgi:thymidylate synthase ThyX
MFNWRSFAHFQKLRNEEHAQIEIQEIAQKMLALVEETNQFPFTINAMRVANLLPKQ